MADLHERILAELENIGRIVDELKRCGSLSALSALELAGTGALLHNFYNGIENILKQVLLHEGIPLPSGTYWHKDLLEASVNAQILSASTKLSLGPFLAFRHFFVHAYSFNLRADMMSPLVDSLPSVYDRFIEDLKKNGYL